MSRLWASDSSGTELATRRLPGAGATHRMHRDSSQAPGRDGAVTLTRRIVCSSKRPRGQQTQTSTPWLTPQILCAPKFHHATSSSDQQRVGFLQPGPDPRVSLPPPEVSTQQVWLRLYTLTHQGGSRPDLTQGPWIRGSPSGRIAGALMTNTLRPSEAPGPEALGWPGRLPKHWPGPSQKAQTHGTLPAGGGISERDSGARAPSHPRLLLPLPNSDFNPSHTRSNTPLFPLFPWDGKERTQKDHPRNQQKAQAPAPKRPTGKQRSRQVRLQAGSPASVG